MADAMPMLVRVIRMPQMPGMQVSIKMGVNLKK
jgi:hypothetical protein